MLCPPVGGKRRREWLKAEAVILKRNNVPMIGGLFNRVAGVADNLSNEGYEDLLLKSKAFQNHVAGFYALCLIQ